MTTGVLLYFFLNQCFFIICRYGVADGAAHEIDGVHMKLGDVPGPKCLCLTENYIILSLAIFALKPDYAWDVFITAHPLFSPNIRWIIVCYSLLPDRRDFYVFSEAEPHNANDHVGNFPSRLAVVILLCPGLHLFASSAGVCCDLSPFVLCNFISLRIYQCPLFALIWNAEQVHEGAHSSARHAVYLHLFGA